MSTTPTADSGTATPQSVADLEASLTQARDALAADLEALGERLSPDALKAAAKDQARTCAKQTKERVTEAAQQAWTTARDAASELASDAKKGDPKAIAIAAAGIAAVAGLSCLAVLKIARGLRH